MEDMPNITIDDVNVRPPDSIDTWIANAQFESKGVFYQYSGDIIALILNYFNHVGGLAGTASPLFTAKEQFLFDLPHRGNSYPAFDVLVVNAQPTSGQVPGFDNAALNDLIGKLALRRSVVCTNPTTALNAMTYCGSIRRIAELSMHCRLIVGVATGPIWATFNTQNRSVPRHILLAPQHLDYGPTVPITNHADVLGVEEALMKEGWL